MSRLEDIAIKVVAPEAGLSGNADALLYEIADLLARLVEQGHTGAIDLRSLPLTPADRAHLHAQLGDGEVRAEVQAFGMSEVRETSYRGVWWITHRDAAGELSAELIEVTPLPAILATDADEIADALARLRARLAAPVTGEL
jgi:hydrogenase-1 operon protein HyaF